jgi:hypothetical protein
MGWLNKAEDGEQLNLYKNNWINQRLSDALPGGGTKPPHLRRIEWEANNWHYDLPPVYARPGLTDESNYDIQATIGPRERANRQHQTFLCTIPFPMDWQGPTVAVPWAGEFAGKAVQAPMGYATIFDLQACWHRGDRWVGSRRGLLLQKYETHGRQ